MKIIKSSVSILEQDSGIIGMFKHLERVGRLAYKSEDRITDDSWKRFIKMIYDRGHHAVFNLGTVYLTIPENMHHLTDPLKDTRPWTKWRTVGDMCYITTNFRVICQLEMFDLMKEYWSEPTIHHYERVTAHWICSRNTAIQILRHRILCPIMESQRYCNYSKEKFGSELTYILPQWIYDIREDHGNTIDTLTGELRSYLLDLDGEDLWKALCVEDRTVAGRDKFFHEAEFEYIEEINEGLKPEDARGVLPGDVKTELCTCGYIEDWMYEPEEDSTEKAGFFYLRTAPDAQRDLRVLATDLKNQFIEKGLDKLIDKFRY